MTAVRKHRPRGSDESRSKVVPISREAAAAVAEQQQRNQEQPAHKSATSILNHYMPNILRSPLFLILFSLTIMNAFLYVYLARHDFPAITVKTANAVYRQTFGRDYTYFSPIAEFLSEAEHADAISYPEFKGSVDRLNQNISRLGLFTGTMLQPNSFVFRDGAIFRVPTAVEGRTRWRPQAGR